MADRIVAAIGHHGFWGVSATFSFVEAIANIPSALSPMEQPLRILLLHPGDIRHIFASISKRLRSQNSNVKPRPIHFYICEWPLEVLCRELILLDILLDTQVPIRQRANIFLEIYGNCKVQERTCRYIEELGQELRQLIAFEKGKLGQIIDFSYLKFREKDELEDVLKSYARSNPFDVDSLRDHRLRGYYAERYDSRLPLSDWDWHTGIKPTASIIHIKQFKDWRMNGIAYEFGDQTYTEPNRTLLSYTEGVLKKGKDAGMKKEVKGFWADIVASPYFSFGIDCDTPNVFAEGLFEILNKDTGVEQHRHNTAEVAVYNVISMLWEMESGGGSQYRMTRAHDIFSGLGVGLGDTTAGTKSESKAVEVEVEVPRVEHCLPPVPTSNTDNSDNTVPPSLSEGTSSNVGGSSLEKQEAMRVTRATENVNKSLDGVKIFPILGTASSIKCSSKMPPGFFDAIFVSTRAAHWLDSAAPDDLLRPGGLVAVETSKFLVPLTRTQKSEFNLKLNEYCDKRGWQSIPAPVYRRRRDEKDTVDDILKPSYDFFMRDQENDFSGLRAAYISLSFAQDFD
eukprot:gene12230-25681_t